jgi:hypothetical protein
MENELTFFFDSYALIEVYEGNPKYEKYKNVKIITSFLQAYETYYSLIRNGYNEEEIKEFFNFIKKFCINLNFEWIPESVRFRRIYVKRDLSYADCLGYIISKNLGVKFLTGDKEFKDLGNVEFVEK